MPRCHVTQPLATINAPADAGLSDRTGGQSARKHRHSAARESQQRNCLSFLWTPDHTARLPMSAGDKFARQHAVTLFPSLPLSWPELARRTYQKANEDNFLDLAAQLSYYFFLALFPAILFLLALASFFPLQHLTDNLGSTLGSIASPEVSQLIQDQMQRLGNAQSGGLLTFGVLAALWSSSAALVSIVAAVNRAYDITEGRPWWKVRVVAIGLTIGTALLVLIGLSLVLGGPALATYLGDNLGWGPFFKWTWLIAQWPLVFAMITTAIGLVYYFGPDAEQDWTWVSPGALVGTFLWLIASLAFKVYVAKFTDYNAAYGAVGGVIVMLLWFYISGIALILGAEMNATIEHASPYGKAPGQKSPTGKRLLGARAARAFAQPSIPGRSPVPVTAMPAAPAPSPTLGLVFAAGVLLSRYRHRRQAHIVASHPTHS
jgi:membrane protein